jgi:hypothetical protein
LAFTGIGVAFLVTEHEAAQIKVALLTAVVTASVIKVRVSAAVTLLVSAAPSSALIAESIDVTGMVVSAIFAVFAPVALLAAPVTVSVTIMIFLAALTVLK